MAHLARADWLHHAQRLAVGQKRRVRHGTERTAAMDVWNQADRWSAYCHRCHLSGVVYKEHQQVRRAIIDPDRVSPVPADALRLSEAWDIELRIAWSLLIEKGCPPGVIPDEVLYWSRQARRVLLRLGPVALGRAVDPNRLPKWLPYGAWQGLPMVWTTRQGAGAMVLVEDALSGYKVAKAIDTFAPESSACVVATLGTRITDRFLPYCINRPLVGMYDGDGAGARGFADMRRRMGVWGYPVLDRSPDKGDPKNMELAAIFAKLEDIV